MPFNDRVLKEGMFRKNINDWKLLRLFPDKLILLSFERLAKGARSPSDLVNKVRRSGNDGVTER